MRGLSVFTIEKEQECPTAADCTHMLVARMMRTPSLRNCVSKSKVLALSLLLLTVTHMEIAIVHALSEQ